MMVRLNWKLLILCGLVFAFVSCGNNDDDDADLLGNWKREADFMGDPRSDAAVFVINNKAYVGTGFNGSENKYYNDFYCFDGNSWTRIADFGGVARSGAVAFSANGKGYVGTGTNGTNRLKDFYEYDPINNSWTRIADFAGGNVMHAVAFSISNTGYVGTGTDVSDINIFYKYDASVDEWVAIETFKRKLTQAVSFVINEKAYILMGSSVSYNNEMFSYNPLNDEWSLLSRKTTNVSDDSYDDDYDIVGTNAVAFTIGEFGYVTTGGRGTAGSRTWEYNSLTDLWEEKTSFEGLARENAVSFTLNNIPYVGLGNSSGYYMYDLWSFDPNAEEDEND